MRSADSTPEGSIGDILGNAPCGAAPAPEDLIWFQRFESTSPWSPQNVPTTLSADFGALLQLSGNDASLVNAQPGCGNALSFGPSRLSYGVITDELRLRQGVISLWVRFATEGQLEGIISRDANGQVEAGHLTLMRASDMRIGFRLQAKDSGGDLLCSDDLAPPNTWHHIRVTFGGDEPPTLTLNGRQTLFGEKIPVGTEDWSCTVAPRITHGIEGNSLPLVVGGSLMGWHTAQPVDVQHKLHGSVDEIVISGVRATLP
ncbi:MAG: hypothetical protein JRH20_20095 [Deltaproteobacteria bacterium]|nr:hypothetical protein [Deltaproteobacteria bacterium]